MQSLRSLYQLKITLADIQPPIWRTLTVPSSIGLAKLHAVLQIAMGWKDCHLHQYTLGKVNYGIPDPEFADDIIDESGVRLSALLKSKQDSLVYEYDFGDGWVHTIVLEDVAPYTLDTNAARCLAGERACPPENIGGPPGYEYFMSAWADSAHPEHKDIRQWAGKRFSPDKFDMAAINKKLAKLRL